MRITIEQLRTGIVGFALLLIVGIIGFLGYAHYQHRFLSQDLPAKLGVHIQSSANGVTYSTTGKNGRPSFLLHAAKVVQFKEKNRQILHDVSIVLYGPNGNRNDRIYGDNFEYDKDDGLFRAQGEVQIDLDGAQGAAPDAPSESPSDDASSSKQESAQEQKTTIHVKTSNLVLNQKTGDATTDQPVEFHFPKAAGTAKGANYDSHSGILVLQSAVELSTSVNGDPLQIHAIHAEITRATQQCYLLNVSTDYQNERSTADAAVVHFRKDGSADSINAKGNIHLRSDSGQELTSQMGEMQLDQRSQPKSAHLSHGVLFSSEDAVHHMHGTAAEAFIDFAAKAEPKHTRLLHAVSFVDQQQGMPNDPRGSLTREVRGSQLDIDFVTDDQQHTRVQKALAQGGAALTMHTVRTKAPQQLTTIEADSLLADFTPEMAISQLTGTGHTKLTDLEPDGTTQVSTGDSLLVHLHPQPKKQGGKQPSKAEATTAVALTAETTQIQSAVQSGHVTLIQQPPKGKTAADGTPLTPMIATAEKAEYQADRQLLQLTGSPQIHDGALDLTSQVVEYSRATGDSTASGDVKATYLQTGGQKGKAASGKGNQQTGVLGGQGPVHIISDKAHLDHATGDAIFTGQARLWQDSNSISAPFVELSRTHQTLKAHADTGHQQVLAIFLTPAEKKQAPSLVRINSHDLVYSDAERKGVFRGSVVAQSGEMTIRSAQAEVFLSDLSTKSNNNKNVRSQVDRLIATGNIILTQPGRKATGDKLVYTASDGKMILTGTDSVLPHLYDETHGNVTGDALIFNSRDDSVDVEGQGQKSITQTRAPK